MEKKFWRKEEHGGVVRKGKRKCARFIDVSRPTHLVFRASKARGPLSFLHRRNKGMIHLLLLHTAGRFDIKIMNYVNVGNHIHLLVKAKTRETMRAFLRVFPQRLMFQVTGAAKGNPRGRFFDEIVYTRVVNWGAELVRLKEYFWKNILESLGYSRKTIIAWRKASREVPL